MKKQSTPNRTTNIIIRIFGIVLFVAGISAAYAHFPIDHPWWFDLGGVLVSFAMVFAPNKIVDVFDVLMARVK